jgi:hypothetical protein
METSRFRFVGCLKVQSCLDVYVVGMLLFRSCFVSACGAIMLAAATGTTISCLLGRQYGPVLSLSLLDVYGYQWAKEHIYICTKKFYLDSK